MKPSLKWLPGGRVLKSAYAATAATAMEGRVFLDLARTAAPMIKRVMGSAGYRQFRRFHRLGAEASRGFTPLSA
jgi:hypothetical protein